MSKECKKMCVTLHCTEHLLILAPAVTGCVSISAFASVVGVPIESLNTVEVLNSTALIDSYISHHEFVLVNIVI